MLPTSFRIADSLIEFSCWDEWVGPGLGARRAPWTLFLGFLWTKGIFVLLFRHFGSFLLQIIPSGPQLTWWDPIMKYPGLQPTIKFWLSKILTTRPCFIFSTPLSHLWTWSGLVSPEGRPAKISRPNHKCLPWYWRLRRRRPGWWWWWSSSSCQGIWLGSRRMLGGPLSFTRDVVKKPLSVEALLLILANLILIRYFKSVVLILGIRLQVLFFCLQ